MFFPEIFSRSSFWSLSFDHGVNIIVDMSSYCENNSSTSCRSTGDTLPGSSIKPQIVPVTNAACDRYFLSYTSYQVFGIILTVMITAEEGGLARCSVEGLGLALAATLCPNQPQTP